MWEQVTKIEICEIIWWIIKILCLWYTSPVEKKPKIENDYQYVLMNVKLMFLMNPVLHREYYLFSQNSESSLKQ